MKLLIERLDLSFRCRHTLALAGFATIEDLFVPHETLLAIRNFSYNCLWELWDAGLILDKPN